MDAKNVDHNLRDMKRSDWQRISKRRYVARPSSLFGPGGVESLIAIDDITAPLTVNSAGAPVKIVEGGYAWLQIAPPSDRFWLTAMFDERDALLQVYFDITGGSRFDDPQNPTFEDMYLDVVLLPDGQFFVLDKDELDAALLAKTITSRQHDEALKACQALCEMLVASKMALMDELRRLERSLKAMLTGK